MNASVHSLHLGKVLVRVWVDYTLSRVGRWKDAVTANIRAFHADMALSEKCMVAYGPEHNTDMLIYAANMAGLVRHLHACWLSLPKAC